MISSSPKCFYRKGCVMIMPDVQNDSKKGVEYACAKACCRQCHVRPVGQWMTRTASCRTRSDTFAWPVLGLSFGMLSGYLSCKNGGG